jgi:hypothetical protein
MHRHHRIVEVGEEEVAAFLSVEEVDLVVAAVEEAGSLFKYFR